MPSMVIRSYYYDAEKHLLRVDFNSGTVYEYINVPVETYRALKISFSKGEYLNRHIKGHYDFRKIK